MSASIPQQDQTPNTSAVARAWDIDPSHSVAEFAVRHMMISTVTGRFKDLKGTLHIDEQNPSNSRVEAEIGVASIDTATPDRDAHLRSPDFFDAENHPVMTFRSTRVEQTADEAGRIVGELTIRGVTREVTLDVVKEGEITDPWHNRRYGFTATTTIDRKDWGLTWNQVLETGGVLVADKVRITLRVQAVERKAAHVEQ